MITGGQIKAARALLGWTVDILATRSNLQIVSVVRAESGRLEAEHIVARLNKIQLALEAAGVEFTDGHPGVRLRKEAQN